MSKHFIQADGSHLLKADLASAKQMAADLEAFKQATAYESLPEHIRKQFSQQTFNRLHNIECPGCGLVSCQCELERAEAEEMWKEEGL